MEKNRNESNEQEQLPDSPCLPIGPDVEEPLAAPYDETTPGKPKPSVPVVFDPHSFRGTNLGRLRAGGLFPKKGRWEGNKVQSNAPGAAQLDTVSTAQQNG